MSKSSTESAEAIHKLTELHAEFIAQNIDTASAPWATTSPWIEYTTGFIDSHNDYIQVYIRKNGFVWEISDGGYFVTDVYEKEMAIIATRKIEQISKRHGLLLEVEDNKIKALTKQSKDADLVKDIHSIIQAVIELNQVD